MLRKCLKGVSLVVCSVFLLATVPAITYAQTPEPQTESQAACSDGVNVPLTALFGADKDDYTVYVRLGQPQQRALVTVQEQQMSGSTCRLVGSITASGDIWQSVGVWKSLGKDQPINFSLSSSIVNGLPDANRPSLMLISKTKPLCVPTTGCVVTIDGRQGVINSAGTLLNEDTLHVQLPVDPASSRITGVDYYIDSKPTYSTRQLEDFNLRYVGPGNHKLSTVVNYDAKQQVIIESSIDRSLGDGATFIFYSTLYGNRTLVTIVASLALFALAWAVVLAIVRKLYLRHLWKVTHTVGPIASPQTSAVQSSKPAFGQSNSGIHRAIRFSLTVFILSIAAAFIIFVVNGFVVQIYHVDGPSMNTTLHNGQTLVVNKLSKTWSRLSGRPYTPKRGDIIVFVKAQSFYDSGEKNYVVKRVVGLPGERVVVTNGVITVYNDQRPDGFNPDQGFKWSQNVQKSSGERIDLTVGQGEVFVVGDNRPESVDSRSYGPINAGNIIGTVRQ